MTKYRSYQRDPDDSQCHNQPVLKYKSTTKEWIVILPLHAVRLIIILILLEIKMVNIINITITPSSG